jgi:multidrug efflux pump subunit AcrB
MEHGQSDAEIIRTTHNTARFFTENRHISWVLLVATLLWGVYGAVMMPKRKDPVVPINVAAVVTVWPGASAERIEDLVTRKVEEKLAENARVEKIDSISRSSISVITVALDERVTETGKEFDDLKLKLDGIRDLPTGAGPIQFIKDFGDTAALMLTVASPPVDNVMLGLRSRAIAQAIAQVRAGTSPPRAAVVVCFPESMGSQVPSRQRDAVSQYFREKGFGRDIRALDGTGFVGFDAEYDTDDAGVLAMVGAALAERLPAADFHPDMWRPAVIRDPRDTEARLVSVAGEKYSYRQLDEFTATLKRNLQAVPQVSKISRAGLLEERIYLEYSQERLAAFGSQLRLDQILGARNITLPGGRLEIEGKGVIIDPSGEFKSEKEVGDVIVSASSTGLPVYLRDGIDIQRGYESPPLYLNYFYTRDASGEWGRHRAITLALQMRPGEQIAAFGAAVDAMLEDVRQRLPPDLILARTSDQPVQVSENLSLFMKSLYEAIFLVVLVALVGFWEWRSAVLMAASIPLTLAMTFGMMHLLGVDLQQVSIASLIIALGLLVDDPVVAGDAIKRDLDAGHPPIVAAWLGPTKLATAILFATITNIVAYLPFLMVHGGVGHFIYSLPIVLACSLVASRIVSMTFIPLLGYYLLRPSKKPEPPMEERRAKGFTGYYYRVGTWALDHRKSALVIALGFLVLCAAFASGIKQQFFPKDLSYLAFIDVWLPEDAALSSTNEAAERSERIVRDVAVQYGKEHPGRDGKPREVLSSICTFVGGGGPRFWFSIAPELQQLNYAQLLLKFEDKHETEHLVPLMQHALSAGVPGARVDVRQLETGKPIGIPVAVRFAGEDMTTLRQIAEKAKDILRAVPQADRVRDDWGAESFSVKLIVDPDRANFAGISNQDIAYSSAGGMNGFQVTTLHEGDRQIPVIFRLRAEERARLSDVQNLYVTASQGGQKVPLRQVSKIGYAMETEKIRRRNQFRTITVAAFPVPGALPSEVLNVARPGLNDLEKTLPPGYRMALGGEEEEQKKGFGEMAIVMMVSVAAIFLALVFQFRNAVKPLIVFSAIPFGAFGAVATLGLMGSPFGFMAFLGVASLVGVIVSHVIVLFDFIEEMHAKGEPLREALLDAGIVRLRPVIITVGATVFGLVPLALHGGPLWEPMCYVQIGGLLVATFVTLLLVPVLYAVFVLDLKIVEWKEAAGGHHEDRVDRTQPMPTPAS